MSPRTLVAAGAALATAYLALALSGAAEPLAVAVKAAAVAPLVLAAVVAARESRRRGSGEPGAGRLAVGLACHLAGDVLIETAPLPAAMAAFLAGHLVYLSLLLRWRQPWWWQPGWRRVLAVALVVDAGALVALVVPRAGELAIPVVVYALALLLMALAATFAAAPARLAAGAALFVLSDSLLAVDLFVRPLAADTLLVWPTYWLGQALMATAMLQQLAEGGARRPRRAGAAPSVVQAPRRS